jgi:P27 family predicted phage terminase small subunit
MQRGRKPKPIALHRLEGTLSTTRHRHRQVEPQAEGELADVQPPVWMTPGQKRVWRAIIKDAPKGVLRKADRTTFRNYVIAAERFETAARMQNKLDTTATLPLLIAGSAGLMISPYIKIMDRATIIMTQLGAELGFSPTARARLGQPQSREPRERDANWAALRRFPVVAGGKTG